MNKRGFVPATDIKLVSLKVRALSSGVHPRLNSELLGDSGLNGKGCFRLWEFLFLLQDQLSADMYNFASKEGDYARYYVMVSAENAANKTVQQPTNTFGTGWSFVHVLLVVFQLLEAQAEHHRRSLAALEAAIPTIQMQQGEEVKREKLVGFIVGWRDGLERLPSGASLPSEQRSTFEHMQKSENHKSLRCRSCNWLCVWLCVQFAAC